MELFSSVKISIIRKKDLNYLDSRVADFGSYVSVYLVLSRTLQL